jgi:hypothetical protein
MLTYADVCGRVMAHSCVFSCAAANIRVYTLVLIHIYILKYYTNLLLYYRYVFSSAASNSRVFGQGGGGMRGGQEEPTR